MINIKPSQPIESGVNLTPLVDIVFQLIIFFMLASYFIQPEGLSVNLPRAEGVPRAERAELVITVDAAGQASIDGRAVTLDELEDRVRAELAKRPELPVVIKADRDSSLQAAVSIMERCQKAGAGRLTIATEAPAPMRER